MTKAIVEVGFRSNRRSYEGCNTLGMTPSTNKRRAAGGPVRSTVVKCSLGWLLVAATERGICAIEFGESAEELQKRLVALFSRAELVDGEVNFSDWVTQVLKFIDAPHCSLDLPLDIQGTTFQQRVWQALQAIPPGSTLTYAEVAKQIGRPSAVRAVARACATNPVSVVIPCHRVIGSDGKLTGYRWGLERKRALLDREAAGR